jgi:hypothetical protein
MSEESVGTGSVGAETPSGATSSPQGSATQSPSPAQATPSASTFSGAQPTQGTDDRAGWVPPYRLRETREAAAREYQGQIQQLQSQYTAEIERMRQQIGALTGFNQPQNPEVTNVRNQFGELFPGLAQLEERAAQLLELSERAGDFQSQQEHYWTNYGRQQMDRLFSGVEKVLGTQLSDEGRRIAHANFVGFVGQSPEMTARYGQDPTLVDEYVKSFVSQFIEPARRAASAGVQTRAAGVGIPQDRPGSAAPPVAQAPKPANVDERAQAGLALYQAMAKSRIPEQSS